MKLCYDCDRYLPIDQFWRNRRRPDGRAQYCRACMQRRQSHTNEPRPHRASERVRQRILADRKVCPGCGVEKVLSSDFYPNPGHTADGYTNTCKQCHVAYVHRTENKERVREYGRIWRDRNRDHYTQYQAAYREAHRKPK